MIINIFYHFSTPLCASCQSICGVFPHSSSLLHLHIDCKSVSNFSHNIPVQNKSWEIKLNLFPTAEGFHASRHVDKLICQNKSIYLFKLHFKTIQHHKLRKIESKKNGFSLKTRRKLKTLNKF